MSRRVISSSSSRGEGKDETRKQRRRRSKATSTKRARPKARAQAKKAAKAVDEGREAGEEVGQARGAPAPAASRWVKFVEKHGVVLASARGPVPNVAEAVAGEPIVGSWWAHTKGKAIFAALSEIDDSADVRCFKLVDGKVTFVHRKHVAGARAARARRRARRRAASSRSQQEHMPTGEHRNIVTPFPEWVDDGTAAAAEKLAEREGARAARVDRRPGVIA